MNLFHRPSDDANSVDPAPADPSPLPEIPPPRTITPISLSPLDEANLCHALHRKLTRVLKDLSLDGHEENISAVVGGAGQPSAGRDQPPGPIV